MPRFLSRNASTSISVGGTTNGGLSIANASSLNPTAAVTVEAYFYLESLNTTSNVIFDNSTLGTTNSYYVDVLTSGAVGNIRFFTTVGGAAKSLVITSTSILPRKWYFLSVTYTGSAMTVFLDGQQIGTLGGLSGALGTNSNALYIGRYYAGTAGYAINGYIYRPRVYNVACSLAEHQDRFYSGITSTSLQSGLVLDLAMTEGSGSTIADISGQGNNATIVSPATWTAFTPFKQRLASIDKKSSLNFSASSDRVDTGTDWIGAGDVTVVGFIRPTSIVGSIGRILANGKYILRLTSNTIGLVSNGATNASSASILDKQNSWIFFSVTRTSAGVTNFRINGASSGTADQSSGTPAAGTTNAIIGNDSGAATRFPGQISFITVFNRILSTAEQDALYYSFGTALPSDSATSVVRNFRFEEGAGTVANDSSANLSTGTITGATYVYESPSKARKLINGNMVKNGDFEYAPPFTAVQTATTNPWIDGSATGSSTNDLFRWAGLRNATSVEISYDSTTKYSGSYSLKLSTTDTTGRCLARLLPATTAANAIKYGIPVSPNTSYLVTARIKTNNVAATIGATWVRFDALGAAIGSNFNLWTGNSATQDWTLKTTTITTGSTDAYMDFNLSITNTAGNISDAWYDEITLTPVYPEGRVPANGNLVKNFDFEVAPAFTAATNTTQRWIDGTAAGSTTNSTYKWGLTGSGTFSGQFDSSVSHSGVYSLKLSTLAAGSLCSITNTRTTNFSDTSLYGIRVLPNTSYTMTGWMKTNYVSGDATNGAALAVSERDATGAGVTTNLGTYVKTTTDWTLYTVTFTTAANTVYLAFDHRVYGHQGTATLIMDAWFDDIYLAPTTNPGRVAIT